MKKRILAVGAVLVLTLGLLTACGGNQNSGNSEEASGEESSVRVAVVINQKFGDNGPMDDLAEGVARAEKDFDITVKKLESESAAKFEEDIRAMSADYDLVITTFPYMTDATVLVAGEYPDTNYAAIFQFVNVGDTSIPNIWDTEFHGEQAFYINGYIAGKMTRSGTVGMIIGGEEPSPNAEGNGFMLGVKAANPNATVEFAYVGSYEDPAKAKEIASAMISKGADVLQTDAGASNAGVVEAAKEADILVSGEITDFWNTHEGFFGVIGIGFGDTAYKAIEMQVNGNFNGGVHGIRDLSNGGYFMDWETYERFAEANPDFVPILEEAKALEKKIEAGEVEVPFNTEVPNWEIISAQ